MVDGSTEATDFVQTESNRDRVHSFICDVLIPNQLDQLGDYLDENYIEHNPPVGDGLATLHTALSDSAANGGITIRYDKLHRVLAEGNFVLAVSEGLLNGQPAAFYDLFRVTEGKLVEHWDTTEVIPPRSEWKNDNGKF